MLAADGPHVVPWQHRLLSRPQARRGPAGASQVDQGEQGLPDRVLPVRARVPLRAAHRARARGHGWFRPGGQEASCAQQPLLQTHTYTSAFSACCRCLLPLPAAVLPRSFLALSNLSGGSIASRARCACCSLLACGFACLSCSSGGAQRPLALAHSPLLPRPCPGLVLPQEEGRRLHRAHRAHRGHDGHRPAQRALCLLRDAGHAAFQGHDHRAKGAALPLARHARAGPSTRSQRLQRHLWPLDAAVHGVRLPEALRQRHPLISVCDRAGRHAGAEHCPQGRTGCSGAGRARGGGDGLRFAQRLPPSNGAHEATSLSSLTPLLPRPSPPSSLSSFPPLLPPPYPP